MRTCLTVVLFALLVAEACAQESTEAVPVPVVGVSRWPESSHHPYFYAVDLVTVAEPGVRHKCRVSEISADAVTCGHGRRAVVYGRDAVAAIIEPPSHFTLRNSLLVLAGGAGFLAGSFFVPELPLVVIMRAVSGAMILTVPAFGIGDNEPGESVIYQRPETELAVKLR